MRLFGKLYAQALEKVSSWIEDLSDSVKRDRTAAHEVV